MQAETCSERRAGLETKDAEADRPQTSGRPLLRGKRTTTYPRASCRWVEAPRGSAGVRASACIETGNQRNKGSLGGAGKSPATEVPRGTDGPISEVAERFVVPTKAGNSAGGKGPQFEDNAGSGEGRGHWREPISPPRSGAVGGVTRLSEGRHRLGGGSVCERVLPRPRAGCGKFARPVR